MRDFAQCILSQRGKSKLFVLTARWWHDTRCVRDRKSGIDYITRYYEKMIQEKITMGMQAPERHVGARTGCQKFYLGPETLLAVARYAPAHIICITSFDFSGSQISSSRSRDALRDVYMYIKNSDVIHKRIIILTRRERFC